MLQCGMLIPLHERSHRYKRNQDHPEYQDRSSPEYKRMSYLRRMQAQLPLRKSDAS